MIEHKVTGEVLIALEASASLPVAGLAPALRGTEADVVRTPASSSPLGIVRLAGSWMVP
jgi:hypothetical protein